MKIIKNELAIEGVFELIFPTLNDERGEFSRIYCQQQLANVVGSDIKQINLSTNYKKGTVRGLHWQVPPHSEVKVVQSIKGDVFDVIVDLRKDSQTYLSWVAIGLSKQKHNAVVIPQGCAHGFQTLTNDVQMVYYHTASFNAEADRAGNFASEKLNIKWPLPVASISDKDFNAMPITDDFLGYQE